MQQNVNSLVSDPFAPVSPEKYEQIHSILETRLPRSANMYNTVIMLKTTGCDVKMYTFDGDFSLNCWIVFINFREDFRNDISISVPMNPVITDEIKSAFINSGVFDWNQPYIFAGIDATISPMIIEISTLIKLNETKVHPNIYYYMDRESASEIINKPDGAEIRDLTPENGVEFFLNNWKHAMEGSKEYIERALENFTAVGIYKGDEIVSGMLLNLNGFIGMLYTLKKYRGEGLAAICMRSLAKKVSSIGMVPTSSCAHKNFVSKEFHRKIGMKISHECAFITHTGSMW